MALTMAAVAASKGIEAPNLRVEVSYDIRQNAGESEANFQSRVHLPQGLTRREQAILFNSARVCEVQKLLAGEMSFQYQLEVGEG